MFDSELDRQTHRLSYHWYLDIWHDLVSYADENLVVEINGQSQTFSLAKLPHIFLNREELRRVSYQFVDDMPLREKPFLNILEYKSQFFWHTLNDKADGLGGYQEGVWEPCEFFAALKPFFELFDNWLSGVPGSDAKELFEAIGQLSKGLMAFVLKSRYVFSDDLPVVLMKEYQRLFEGDGNPSERKLEVGAGMMRIEDTWFNFKGSTKTKERLEEFFREMLSTREYVSMTQFRLRTREIEAQPNEIRDIVDAQSGAGCRIAPQWFN